MINSKHIKVGLFVFSTMTSGWALADCPNTMPEQLLNDCIVYEGAGNSFPTSDYAHMGQYQDWQKTQLAGNRIAKSQPKALAK